MSHKFLYKCLGETSPKAWLWIVIVLRTILFVCIVSVTAGILYFVMLFVYFMFSVVS